jgi:hypothetical protein
MPNSLSVILSEVQGSTANTGTGINSIDDFCIWGPPVQDTVGDTEAEQVAYCTHGTHGSRVIPAGTFSGVHFVITPDYVQACIFLL